MNENTITPFSEVLKNNKHYKTAIKFGIYFGVAALILDLVMYIVTNDPLGNRGAGTNILAFGVLFLVSLFLAVKEHKENDLQGFMPYPRILGLGTLIGVFGGLFFGIYAVIKITYLVEIDLDLLVHETMEKANLKLDPEQYETQAAMMKKMMGVMMHPVMIFIVSVLNNAFTGFILSLFAGLFLKKNP